ncbi:MAG: signal recognition particle-docking protein FtsY [Oscillospiraceae bacterium]|nr:signal recognition particle-docking protein FtsY [Oscillospiraceae bacterium]
MSIFTKLREGLARTRNSFSQRLNSVFSFMGAVGEDFYEELEETLIMADLGVATTTVAVQQLRETVRYNGIKTGVEAKAALVSILTLLLDVGETRLRLDTQPSVILVIGVNGVGKTTSIGKLAMKLNNEGKKTLLCAGDTFRAAAGEQLGVWATRVGSEIVRRDEGADPASVIFDGINAAKARAVDVLICDTAGRLHNKSNLMNELSKISRIIHRELPESNIETLLVIDATTGQNGVIQAREFNEIADITGIILTKLDGTAKGGIVYSIAEQLKIPVKLVGVGEKLDDLIEFNAWEFTEAILE